MINIVANVRTDRPNFTAPFGFQARASAQWYNVQERDGGHLRNMETSQSGSVASAHKRGCTVAAGCLHSENYGVDQVAYNARPWHGPLQSISSLWPETQGLSGESNRKRREKGGHLQTSASLHYPWVARLQTKRSAKGGQVARRRQYASK